MKKSLSSLLTCLLGLFSAAEVSANSWNHSYETAQGYLVTYDKTTSGSSRPYANYPLSMNSNYEGLRYGNGDFIIVDNNETSNTSQRTASLVFYDFAARNRSSTTGGYYKEDENSTGWTHCKESPCTFDNHYAEIKFGTNGYYTNANLTQRLSLASLKSTLETGFRNSNIVHVAVDNMTIMKNGTKTEVKGLASPFNRPHSTRGMYFADVFKPAQPKLTISNAGSKTLPANTTRAEATSSTEVTVVFDAVAGNDGKFIDTLTYFVKTESVNSNGSKSETSYSTYASTLGAWNDTLHFNYKPRLSSLVKNNTSKVIINTKLVQPFIRLHSGRIVKDTTIYSNEIVIDIKHRITLNTPVTTVSNPVSGVTYVGGTSSLKIGTIFSEYSKNAAVAMDTLLETPYTLVATENSGYEFVGWYEGSTLLSTSKTYNATLRKDITITPKFREKAMSAELYVVSSNASAVSSDKRTVELLVGSEYIVLAGDINAYNLSKSTKQNQYCESNCSIESNWKNFGSETTFKQSSYAVNESALTLGSVDKDGSGFDTKKESVKIRSIIRRYRKEDGVLAETATTNPITINWFYNVVFESRDGSVCKRERKPYNSLITVPSKNEAGVPEPPQGRIYEYSWTGSDGSTLESSVTSIRLTQNITYTVSIIGYFIVNFYDWDGTLLSTSRYKQNTDQKFMTIPPDPTRGETYRFEGWANRNYPNTVLSNISVDGPIDYKAVYSNRVRFHYGKMLSNGSYEKTMDKYVMTGKEIVPQGKPITEAGVPMNQDADIVDGYHFLGWYKDEGEIKRDVDIYGIIINEPTDIYTKYIKIPEFTISFNNLKGYIDPSSVVVETNNECLTVLISSLGTTPLGQRETIFD